MLSLTKRLIGNKGEEIAIKHLKQVGMQIICKNYKTPFGEVDIIAQDGQYTVFIEVKTRRNLTFGEPYEAVTNSKQEKIRKSALYYQKERGEELMLRFDVISIKDCNGNRQVEHIKEAF